MVLILQVVIIPLHLSVDELQEFFLSMFLYFKEENWSHSVVRPGGGWEKGLRKMDDGIRRTVLGGPRVLKITIPVHSLPEDVPGQQSFSPPCSFFSSTSPHLPFLLLSLLSNPMYNSFSEMEYR